MQDLNFYEIKYDSTKWDVTNFDDLLPKYNEKEGYKLKLINKENYQSYTLIGNKDGDIIGIEQIDSNTFFVYRQYSYGSWHISRLKLENSHEICEYQRIFKKYEFIEEDKILFDNRTIYSIKDNSFRIHKYSNFDVRYNENDEKFLLIKEAINDSNPIDYVIFAIDIKNFEPITDAFSTLRNEIVPLTKDFTVEDLIKEDIKYKQIVEEFNQSVSDKIKIIGQTEILVKAKATNKK